MLRDSKALARGFVATALFASMAAHANLVTNGGFEEPGGTFDGWNTHSSLNSTWDGVDNNEPQAGTYGAFFGNPSGTSRISQTLNTVAGTTYTVSFWLANVADVFGSVTPNSFEFDWGGLAVQSLLDAPEFDYTMYSYSLVAGGSSTDIDFSFSHPGGLYWDFDSVSVQAVPEPGSLALTTLAGMLALIVSKRRRPFPSSGASVVA